MTNRVFVALALTAVLCGSAHAQQTWVACANGDILCTASGENVGIGSTATPVQALEVTGRIKSMLETGSFSVGGNAPSGYQFFSTNTVALAGAGLQFRSNYASTSTSYIGNFGTFGTLISHNREPQVGTLVDAAVAPNQFRAAHIVIGDSQRSRLFQVANYPSGAESVKFFIGYDGRVGIGTITPTQMLDVAGSINVTGNINAKYQDIAEWVLSATQIEPGTVVIVDPTRIGEVVASSTAYDTAAAGVVSAQPGISLGEASDSKIQVATTGRVRVKVDATRNPIKIGDLLVTSDRPGMAMKSMPVNVSGIKMHRPGTLIGKALEPLAKGEGEILVLLSMQ